VTLPSKLTPEEVHQIMLDVQGMIEEYQRQSGLRFGVAVIVTSGGVTSFVSTLGPEQLIPTLLMLAEKVAGNELGGSESVKKPVAH
jgi:hypothetical protein